MIVLKRDEAISVLKELLDNCIGLDGHYLELVPPIAATPTTAGYQIIIRKTLDKETIDRIQRILAKYQLSYQTGSIWKTRHTVNKNEPDTFIIFRKTLPAQKPSL